MIRNVIFDYGNTLVRFHEGELAKSYTKNPEDATLIEEIFFSREYWSRLDEGTLTHEEWLACGQERLPAHLHKLLPEIMSSWYYRLPGIEGMASLVHGLKERGVGLYLLSNISLAFAERIREFPILSLFDGIVCSAVYHVTKPDPRIYRILLDTYRLRAEECLFVDDRADNIEAARSLGITGYLFDGDSERLKTTLEDLLR